MRRYVLFAGVNGAGKTTLYHTLDELEYLPRVNVDEIVRVDGDWKNNNDVINAGIKAGRMIKDFLNNRSSFSQETTLCGKSILRNIYKAKELGYSIEIYYVGLESVQLAIERVEKRVHEGGHGIPHSDIERRYVESIHNLISMIPICNRLVIYDNTSEFRKVATFENGVLVFKSNRVPRWCEGVIPAD